MPLESVTHISDLNVSNPAGTDAKNQGDDHLRNVKVALRTDFPNINGVVNCTPAQLNLLNSLTALSVIGNATSGAAAPGAITAAAVGQVLKRSGATLAFGLVDSDGGGFHTKYVTADQNFASTTLANITDLQTILTMDADTIYVIEGLLDFVPSANGGFKAALIFSQTPQAGRLITADPAGSLGTEFNGQAIATAIGSIGSGANEWFIKIDGAFVHTHATLTSTLSLQGALNSASGNVNLKRGSWIRVSKFGVA